jgi:hypothetical protein
VISVQKFLNVKSQQLAYFVRAFWNDRIVYNELDLYFWDTMEEWSQVSNLADQPSSQRERVFWYVLHQLNYWPEQHLREDSNLRSDLDLCVNFLESQEEYPFPLEYSGARP